ncbi:MAG: LamG-like jellyroll fold domain-containing protein [Candidatus Paceibacterota bacterium]|jgi:prepilin-type N-terminal cleavage/methylation domain-containing protein
MNKLIKQAFTLIELLVVIAIIGILSGLIVVSMSGVTQKANLAKAQVFSNSLRNALLLNLVAEYKLDGNANNSWNQTNGTVYEAVTLTSGCVQNYCLSFDGSNDYGEATLNSFSSETISLWIKLNNYSASGKVLGINAHAQGNNAIGSFDKILYVNESGKAGWYVWDTAERKIIGTTSLQLNTWYNIVGVIGVGGQKIFVNGQQENINTSVVISWNGGTLFDISFNAVTAGETNLAADHFNGLIDEVRIYNAVIPTSQIKEQYYVGLNSLLANGSINNKEYKEKINSVARQ